MHSIEFTREAAKVLDRPPRNVRALVMQKIEAVMADSQAQHNNVMRMQDGRNFGCACRIGE